ncbi:YpsA SLOG family protein [Thermodesulfobacteriota bacterium]
MIKKIVSGGQTGADRAALDVAIELDIPHGGWIPKGRKTESGALPDKYNLQEMPTASYAKRTEQNVIDSDGTLIISHGELSGGSSLTHEFAEQYNKKWLRIDLEKIRGFSAAQAIKNWLLLNNIKILNVAGSRQSEDHEIYDDTKRLLKAVFNLFFVESKSREQAKLLFPRTVEDAVERLMAELPLKDKTLISKMEEDELPRLYSILGKYIKENYGLWLKNGELMKDCKYLAKDRPLHADDASALIISELWKALRETHSIRIIK